MAGVPWHSKDDWDMAPSMLNCDPESPSQRWSVDEQTGIVKNLGLGMCVQAVDGTPSFKVHGVPQSLNHPAPLSRSVLHPKADMRQSVHVPMLPEQKRLQLPVCLLLGCPLNFARVYEQPRCISGRGETSSKLPALRPGRASPEVDFR